MGVPWIRLLVAWATVLVFAGPGYAWLAGPQTVAVSAGLFAWLLAVIIWSAFGVVHEAEELAETLGDPLGTLVLTLAIVVIEVALISAVMLTSEAPTLGRDTMFAVLMIVLKGVVGLGLVLGGLRHGEQSYNLQGAAAYLAVIIPLSVIPLILPNFTVSTPDGSLATVQAVAFSVFTIVLYGLFLALQTGRHRGFFVHPRQGAEEAHAGAGAAHPAAGRGAVARHALLLVLNILPIVLLSKSLAGLLDQGLAALGAPAALGGLLIAMVVFTPEAITSLRAVTANELQRAVNLCLGAVVSQFEIFSLGLVLMRPSLRHLSFIAFKANEFSDISLVRRLGDSSEDDHVWAIRSSQYRHTEARSREYADASCGR